MEALDKLASTGIVKVPGGGSPKIEFEREYDGGPLSPRMIVRNDLPPVPVIIIRDINDSRVYHATVTINC